MLMNDGQVFIDTAVNMQQHCQFLMFDVFYSYQANTQTFNRTIYYI